MTTKVVCFQQIGNPNPHYPTIQEKHFKVLTEVMTEMFIQCGLVIEENFIEMDNYQDFLKCLVSPLIEWVTYPTPKSHISSY